MVFVVFGERTITDVTIASVDIFVSTDELVVIEGYVWDKVEGFVRFLVEQ